MFIAGTGICNVDILYSGMARIPKEGEEIYSNGFDIQLGGGPPATLINLSRLGVPTKLGTFLGNDIFSNFIRGELEKYKVRYENFYYGDGMPLAITSAVITQNDRSFISYRDSLDIDDRIKEEIFLMSKGSKITEMEIGFIEVYKELKKEGVKLVLDMGWTDDMTIEKYADYIELADYYTPNQKEALKMTGTTNPEDALSILGKYFSKAIVKLDKDGCLVSNNGKRTLLPPIKNIEVIDSTGAGDAFLSGFLYGLFKELTFEEAILCGNITGGECVQGVGCLTSYVNEKQLLERLNLLKKLESI